jgi:nitroimidazol reductase NimA-like FMN-containing flavoprotein (pyridoxamine 5'-phosphate oxidase superfamily)
MTTRTGIDTWSAVQQDTFAHATPATQSAWPAYARMSESQLVDFLDEHRFGVLATGRPDGRPHAVPIAYLRAGVEIWLPAMGGSVRARNLAEQPWAVLVVSEGDGRSEEDPAGWHRMCMVEGRAELRPADSVPAAVSQRASWASHFARLVPERVYSYMARG